jgi:TM2 domain-containing membrane protein YozV
MLKTITSYKMNPLLAAGLAWLVPGAGHFYLRKPARGLILFVTIGLTFWGGVAMGGAMTVSRQAEPWWFAADMLAGSHGLAAWQCQKRVFKDISADAKRKALAGGDRSMTLAEQQEVELVHRNVALVPPVDTAARAFSGVAGLLNLLCIFDALMLGLLGRVGEPPRQAGQMSQPAAPPAVEAAGAVAKSSPAGGRVSP